MIQKKINYKKKQKYQYSCVLKHKIQKFKKKCTRRSYNIIKVKISWKSVSLQLKSWIIWPKLSEFKQFFTSFIFNTLKKIKWSLSKQMIKYSRIYLVKLPFFNFPSIYFQVFDFYCKAFYFFFWVFKLF